MKKSIVSLTLFLLSCSITFTEEQVQVQSAKIPFNGLTRTIADLFKAKPKTKIQLGSFYLNPEDFVEQNLYEIFDCDEAGNEYLSGTDDMYYEQFANVISEEISNNISDKSAYSNIIVNASEDGSIILLGIAVHYVKNAILPVYFDTINSDLKLSASIDCVIDYQITFDLELDVDKINNNDILKGTNVTLYDYTIEIKPIKDDSSITARIVYNNDFSNVVFNEENIYAYISWRLPTNVVGDEEEPQKITYGQLQNGDYQWEVGFLTNMFFSGVSINDDESNELEKIEVSVDFENTTSPEFQYITVTDDEGTKELLVKQLEL